MAAAKYLGMSCYAAEAPALREEAWHCGLFPRQPSTHDTRLLPMLMLGLWCHGSCPGIWLQLQGSSSTAVIGLAARNPGERNSARAPAVPQKGDQDCSLFLQQQSAQARVAILEPSPSSMAVRSLILWLVPMVAAKYPASSHQVLN